MHQSVLLLIYFMSWNSVLITYGNTSNARKGSGGGFAQK